MTDTDTDPFEFIDSPWGHIERWRASTLATGTMGCLAEVYQMVRNDAAEVEARANEIEARKGLVQHLCDQIAGMQERINRLEDALEARHKADAERAARDAFENEPMPEPPGTQGPSIAADLSEPAPTGELHDLPAKGELPEPPLEVEDQGGLPEELDLNPDLPEPPTGQVQQQPVSISLNEG
jgi:hypothetical protein